MRCVHYHREFLNLRAQADAGPASFVLRLQLMRRVLFPRIGGRLYLRFDLSSKTWQGRNLFFSQQHRNCTLSFGILRNFFGFSL